MRIPAGAVLLWAPVWSHNEKAPSFPPEILGKEREAAGCVGACVLEQWLLSQGLLCCCGQWPDFLVQAHYAMTELSAHISSSSETSLCFVERSCVSRVPDFKEREVWFAPSLGTVLKTPSPITSDSRKVNTTLIINCLIISTIGEAEESVQVVGVRRPAFNVRPLSVHVLSVQQNIFPVLSQHS